MIHQFFHLSLLKYNLNQLFVYAPEKLIVVDILNMFKKNNESELFPWQGTNILVFY